VARLDLALTATVIDTDIAVITFFVDLEDAVAAHFQAAVCIALRFCLTVGRAEVRLCAVVAAFA